MAHFNKNTGREPGSSSTDDPGAAALPDGVRIVAVVSSYHPDLVLAMAESARAVLTERGLASDAWLVVEAPGAYELPLLAQRLARRADIDAVLCFGLVLRGDTDHDRYISNAVATRLMDVGLACDKPVLFGVLTPNDLGQATRRARTLAQGGLDKGREVALAAVTALAALARIDALETDEQNDKKKRKKKDARDGAGR